MSAYNTPYEALGADGISDLVNTFYDLMDNDPRFADLRAMHAPDLSGIKQKLTEYLTGWMGGPPLYAEKYGTVCMTEPHEHYWIGPKARDEWLACMKLALDAVSDDEQLKKMMEVPLFRIADAVRNRDGERTADPGVIASG